MASERAPTNPWNALISLLDRADRAADEPGRCPACGGVICSPGVPEGYDEPHCYACRRDVERREGWHDQEVRV